MTPDEPIVWPSFNGLRYPMSKVLVQPASHLGFMQLKEVKGNMAHVFSNGILFLMKIGKVNAKKNEFNDAIQT